MLLRPVVKGISLRAVSLSSPSVLPDLSAAQSLGTGLHRAGERCRKSLRRLAVPRGQKTKAALKFCST